MKITAFIVQRPTKIVEGPESPCSPALLDRLDIVVDPAVRYGAAFVWHLELLKESTEGPHPGRMSIWSAYR